MSSTLHHYIITTVTCETVEYDNPNFIWGYIWNVRSAVRTAAQFWKKKELLRAGSLELSLELWRLKTYLNFSYVLELCLTFVQQNKLHVNMVPFLQPPWGADS